MDTSTFRLQRVLMGVVVGLLVVALAVWAWADFRRSQYNDHQRAVLSRYHEAYTLCVTAGNPSWACANRLQTACRADPFWKVAKPFAFNPQVATAEIATHCRSGVTSD
jgi:hypothetical protein